MVIALMKLFVVIITKCNRNRHWKSDSCFARQ